ncbi:MAG: hypothetical protein HN356_12350 [Calditrichaeota bacterium]|jgi:hypothetical protein|nr:hypothetical protein [Calditrichota bacterium]MBT7789110.1 hypothetical protein [Calditrichota bacterium]
MIKVIILVILLYLGFRVFRFFRKLMSNPLLRSKIHIMNDQNQKPAWEEDDIEDADFEDVGKKD